MTHNHTLGGPLTSAMNQQAGSGPQPSLAPLSSCRHPGPAVLQEEELAAPLQRGGGDILLAPCHTVRDIIHCPSPKNTDLIPNEEKGMICFQYLGIQMFVIITNTNSSV